MNVRVWGGWLLAALGITVLMTMGCEKGGLGVRSSNLTGTIIDGASSAPVEGVRVKIVSETAITTNAQAALGQNYISITDANGRFMFTNLTPDKFKLEASKVGYEDLRYPSASSTVTSIYVPNAETIDIGSIKMNAVGSPLPQYISVRLYLRDSKSMELLPSDQEVTITFDDKTATGTVGYWASGTYQLPAKNGNYAVSISPDPNLYKTTVMTLPGTSNILTDILLDANSYNLIVRCVNVPDYIEGGIVNIYAEKKGDYPKVLATQTIDNLGTLTSPNLPRYIEVPGIAFPINLRINVRGYKDEVIAINMPQGEQGNIRIDVDFLSDNSTFTPTLTDTNNTFGIRDNRMTRHVILRVAGKDLLDGDRVEGVLFGASTSVPPVAPAGGFVDVVFDEVPVGYKLPWSVTVTPAAVRAASGSFTLPAAGSTESPTMINPPIDNAEGELELPKHSDIPLIIGVNAKRPD